MVIFWPFLLDQVLLYVIYLKSLEYCGKINGFWSLFIKNKLNIQQLYYCVCRTYFGISLLLMVMGDHHGAANQYSARNQCPPGHSGTILWDVMKTYVEKYSVTYASFCVRTNKIYIIVSTEVTPYPRTSPGKICISRVFQVFSGATTCPGRLSRKMSPGRLSREKNSLQRQNCWWQNRRNKITISLYHDFTISPFLPKTIEPFHHLEIIIKVT